MFARRAIRRVSWPVLAMALALLVRGVAAAEETMRLRIDWGGPAEERWEGIIAVSEGTLAEPRPLGIEADEPGSMWLEPGPLSTLGPRSSLGAGLPIPPGSAWLGPVGEGDSPIFPAGKSGQSPSHSPASPKGMNHLVIRSPSPRAYDGLDLLVTAPREAELRIALWGPRAAGDPEWIAIPLAELISGSRKVDLDDRGDRLMVRRAPGDAIRVTLDRNALVFAPGETLSFTFEPSLLPVEPGSKVRLRVELTEARASRGRLVEEHHLVAGESEPIEQPVTLPDEEGAYDILITATHAAWRRWTQPVRGQQPFATRRIQVLVLGPHAPVDPEVAGSQAVQVEEIDPANPTWWERFAKLPHPRRLPRLWHGPLGNGYSRTRTHPLGQLVELGPCPNPDDLAWEAYTLPIGAPGRPHILEIDYPSDVPQTMGISLIEPNAAGAVAPIGLDSGVELAEELTGHVEPSRWLKHRMIFWPKTKSPMVLITSRREGAPAVYGKIRVLAFPGHLPAFSSPGSVLGRTGGRTGLAQSARRLLAAYLDRPLFPENFSAGQALVRSSGLAADDWVTFHQGGTRLVEYLDHVGFGGLMISVMAGGSTIYPSAVLEPTALYDSGVLQDEGQDPVRKDVLEMLFRLFDRQELDLIPALEFAAPLPALEAELRRGGDASEGIRWVGAEGKTWLETYKPHRGAAPYYNVLHPRVQEAMLAAAREVAQRYRHHGSFAGLAIQLSGQGYAQLPGPNWGMDDVTVGRFERDMNLRVPGEGPKRFSKRAQFLAENYPREWLAWRAEQLSRFYRRVRDELVAVRPQARLYLAGANMFTGDELERALRPALPRQMTISEAMLRVGIDARHYAEDPGVVLLRPERILPERPLARRAVDLEIQQMFQGPNSQPPFAELPISGSLFFNPPQEVRLASFDARSPFEPSYTWLAAEAAPGAWQNRRRFVHSLAELDSQVMFDGGWLLPLGQEDALKNVVAVYRELPAVRFRRLTDQSGADPAQPVTIRYATYGGATYVYVVNDAPFATVAQIDLACPSGCQLEGLGGVRPARPLERDAAGTRFSVELEPYDLVAVRLSAPDVGIGRPQVWWSSEVQTELKARIAELGSRAAALRKPPILDVLENPGFEAEPTEDGRIPGWAASNRPGVTVQLDTSEKRVGNRSVRIASRKPVASLVSQPFDAPSTGRLTMSAWLRGSDAARPPPLHVVLEGFHEGEYFSRYATPQVGPAWGAFPFIVQVDDLPLDGLSRLRIRFDLMGPGEVWIDEVQLSHLVFSKAENNALLKLIAPAEVKLDRAQVRDCLQLLEGYWPRFLLANVQVAETPVVRKPPQVREPEGDPSLLDRMKAFLPRRLRFF